MGSGPAQREDELNSQTIKELRALERPGAPAEHRQTGFHSTARPEQPGRYLGRRWHQRKTTLGYGRDFWRLLDYATSNGPLTKLRRPTLLLHTKKNRPGACFECGMADAGRRAWIDRGLSSSQAEVYAYRSWPLPLRMGKGPYWKEDKSGRRSKMELISGED